MAGNVRYFQIGVIPVALRSSVRRFRKEYERLYAPCRSPVSLPDAVEVDVKPARRVMGYTSGYEIYLNGRLRFSPANYDELLPYVEWAVNWELPTLRPEYLQIHAASMEYNGIGVIFPGDSGSGKSTLATALLTRGWRYLCDEFALLHTRSLELHPFPRAICMKEAANPILERFGLVTHAGARYLKGSKGFVGFVSPFQVRPDCIGRVCPVRYVVFPKHVPGATPTLAPISRAQAAFELHRVCFNLFGCARPGIDVLSAVARGAHCFQLVSGDIEATCSLLEREIDARRSARVRSA